MSAGEAKLAVLSAGAAQGFLTRLAAAREVELAGEFGAVGAMRQRLLDGAPCDLIVLTRAMIEALAAEGRVAGAMDLGSVATSVAVREGDAAPDVSSAERLREALLAAEEIYFPDPQKATAGIHFAKVMDALGVQGNRCTFPNGATAMREMARSRARRVLGCTQASEILNTPGARLVAPLPPGHGLETVYTAAVGAGAANPERARAFIAEAAGEGARELRARSGIL